MDETGKRAHRKRQLRRRTRTTILVLVPLGLLVAAALVARHLWRGVGDTAIGSGGLVVLWGGGIITIALGAALITLMIVSSRRGYDEPDRERPSRRLGK